MNTNINKAFKKTTNGYFGYYRGYYMSAFLRGHGHWACRIGKGGQWLWIQGYFTSCLKNMKEVKRWAKQQIKTDINGKMKK